VDAARAELVELGPWDGPRADPPGVAPGSAAEPGAGEAVLATWRMLIDDSSLTDGEPYLRATGRAPVARMSAATAASAGLTRGGNVTVSTARGSITLPAVVDDLPDAVVWVPQRSAGISVARDLGVGTGSVVRIEGGEA
jgi:NADH-quinone oxidoreductase subunit G